MGRLAGRIALITGIGAGMGREAARRFAAEGARVVGCDIDAAGLDETVAIVRGEGGEITGHVADLLDPDAAARWVEDAAAVHGGIDILYNNAGVQRFAPIDELSVADWELNVKGELSIVFYCVRAAWKHLERSKAPVIINIGSIAGTRGVEFMPQNVHGAAKAGVINLTQQLAVEGGPHRIRVNAISPGFIETPATAFLVQDPPPAMRATWDRIPLGRTGRPDDVVNAAVFLASDEATWITGVNLVVDGGGSVLG